MYRVGSGLGRMPHFARLADGLAGEKRPVTYALALFLILGSSAVLAQSAVTLQELDGVRITARVVRAQVIRREGRDVPTRYESDIKLVMGPGNGLQQHVEATVHGPRGPRKGQTMSSSHKIELPGELRGRGGGQGLFVFENGTLTFLRTFKSGALIRKFEFKSAGSGLTCAMTETFARENGTGTITMNAAAGGGEITIVSWKPVSSTCKIVGK